MAARSIASPRRCAFRCLPTAIENSQYEKLPGPVYAQGFVRAHAVHLGLDGDEAIRRFKQEVDGFESLRSDFPVPLAERSIPGGTMLLAALILAICGYGLWYYVSTGDRMHPDRVGSVPPDMAASQAPPVTALRQPRRRRQRPPLHHRLLFLSTSDDRARRAGESGACGHACRDDQRAGPPGCERTSSATPPAARPHQPRLCPARR